MAVSSLKLQNSDAASMLNSALLFAGIASTPIYVTASGSIQPSHAMLFFFAILTFFRSGIPVSGPFWPILLLALNFLLVESFYVLQGGTPRYLINPIFVFFNFIVGTAIYGHALRHGFTEVASGLIIASLVAVISIVLTGVSLVDAQLGRSEGLFNNPNQVGYFSVCLMSLTHLLYRCKAIGGAFNLVLLFVAAFLALSSLSKAAIISVAVVILFALIQSNNDKVHRSQGPLLRIFVLIAPLVLLIGYFLNAYFEELIFIQRLQGMSSEADSSLEARGYFIITQGSLVEQLIGLGGSGVQARLGHEVHSTLGSLFNTYGVVSLTLFLFVVINWGVRVFQAFGTWSAIACVAPTMLYGITHNGSRATLFWVLLALSFAAARRAKTMRSETSH